MKVDLPGGAWMDLCDVREVSERKRRPVLEKLGDIQASGGFNPDGTPAEGANFAHLVSMWRDLNDLTAVALIRSWSYEQAPTTDSLLDLPGDVYDAVQTAVAPFAMQLMPDFTPNQDNPLDPATPTTPSSA